ncbi:hypothetical protein V2J09_012301 [Rumex salicifolius]
MFSDNQQLCDSSIAFHEDHPTPFPESADFFYDHLIPPPQINQSSHLPPQKLRPIRHNARSLTQDQSNFFGGYAQSIDGCTFPELGFMSESQLTVPDFQFRSPIAEAGGADDLLAALRQINPAQGFDYIISELKKQIPPLDSTSSSSVASGNCHDPTGGKTNPDVKSNNTKKRKRMESFLEDLMMQVINRQEQMHKQLIEAMEKKEAERVVREEAWRRQEIELANKEEAFRAQEASRSLALISFILNAMGSEDILLPTLPLLTSEEGFHETQTQINSSKKTWPKSEVQTLIALRCAFDVRFRDVGSKTSLWKEISFGLNKMGYRRSARKCKEKWLYINKYYKSFVENGIAHSENTKSCPYFQELEILYRNGSVRFRDQQLIVAKSTIAQNFSQ